MSSDQQQSLFDTGPAKPSALPVRCTRPGKRPAKARRKVSPKPVPKPKSDTKKAAVPETRMQSYQRIAALLPELQRVVLEYVLQTGDRGATDEELCQALALRLDTGRARRCELRDMGIVADSTKRRPTHSGRSAVVWTVSQSFSGSPSSPEASPGQQPNEDGKARASVSDVDIDAPSSPATVPAGRPVEVVSQETRQPAAGRRCGLRRERLGSKPGRDPCYWCGQLNWWRSIHGAIVCGDCHPPATPELVQEWIDRTDDRRTPCRD